VTNSDIQTLIDQAVAQIEATTITYGDWKQRVVSGFYAGKHIDPTSGTAWGRGIGYLERARAALDPTPAPTPTPAPVASGIPVPTSSPAGWKLSFSDGFDTDCPVGHFPYFECPYESPAAVAAKWTSYPPSYPVTRVKTDPTVNGFYHTEKAISIHDSLLDLHLHNEAGVYCCAAPIPKLHPDQTAKWAMAASTYGRYSVCVRQSNPSGTYKVAWLLWPTAGSSSLNGEIDCPECNLDETGNARCFHHYANQPEGQHPQAAFDLGVMLKDWQVFTFEWSPGRFQVFSGKTLVGTVTENVPANPMYWVLQSELVLGGLPLDPADDVHVLCDWVAFWEPDTAPAPAPTPSPTPAPSRGADLPVGPFTESKTAKWYRTTAGGTVTKQRVTGAPDYGVATMGFFKSPTVPPDPSTGVMTITDCVGEKIGHEPPTMDGTGEAGIWLGQRVAVDRAFGEGSWMGAATEAQCCDSTIKNLTCAVQNADGSLSRLPRIGLYIEHCTRRVVIDGLTIRSQGNGVNVEWWYDALARGLPDYSPWIAKELPGAPAGKSGSFSVEIRNFDIDSGAWGIFLDAGTCGFHIHDGILRGVNGISHPANLAVPSMPNVIDWATIDFAGSGTKDHVHSNQIG
jgi:hypothetical protein